MMPKQSARQPLSKAQKGFLCALLEEITIFYTDDQ